MMYCEKHSRTFLTECIDCYNEENQRRLMLNLPRKASVWENHLDQKSFMCAFIELDEMHYEAQTAALRKILGLDVDRPGE